MVNLIQRDMAGILKVNTKIIYNWRKNKPELYRIVVLGFKFDEFLAQSRKDLIELEKLAEENKTLRLK
ncbi:transcriptional regulator [Campylobacter concisus]